MITFLRFQELTEEQAQYLLDLGFHVRYLSTLHNGLDQHLYEISVY